MPDIENGAETGQTGLCPHGVEGTVEGTWKN